MFGSSSTMRMRVGHGYGAHRRAARTAPGHDDREPRAGAGHVLGPDPAAGGGQQPARDRRAPCPVPGERLPRRAAAVEPLEQVIELAGIEARARGRSPTTCSPSGSTRGLRRRCRGRRASTAPRSRAGATARPTPGADRSRPPSRRRRPRAARARRARAGRARRRRRRRRPAVTHCRSTRIAAASMRAMSRMSWNSRVSRSSSASAAPACAAALVGRQIAAQVLDGDADRGQRRLQVVAERREQRRRQVGLLPHELGGVALAEELRALDGDRHDAGDRVERAEVERRRDGREQADGLGAVAERHDRARSLSLADAHVAAIGALARVELQRALAPSRAPCSATSTSMPTSLAAALVDRASRGPPAGRWPRWAARSGGRRAGRARRWRRRSPWSAARRASGRTGASLRCGGRSASRARSCAAADRLLAMTATTRNANSAIQFCGSAMVNVPTGGRKKKLSVSIASERDDDRDPEPRAASPRRARPAAAPAPRSSR